MRYFFVIINQQYTLFQYNEKEDKMTDTNEDIYPIFSEIPWLFFWFASLSSLLVLRQNYARYPEMNRIHDYFDDAGGILTHAPRETTPKTPFFFKRGRFEFSLIIKIRRTLYL
jgi:hypothetical protein